MANKLITYNYNSLSINHQSNSNVTTIVGNPPVLSGNAFRIYIYTDIKDVYVWLDMGINENEINLLSDFTAFWDFSKMPQSEINKLLEVEKEIGNTNYNSFYLVTTNDAGSFSLQLDNFPTYREIFDLIRGGGFIEIKVSGTYSNGSVNNVKTTVNSGVEDKTWKLRVNRKNVKMFHDATGKNYKTFTIDGHTFDFRTELTPAQDQGVLQDIIDALDWSHLTLTGIKKYPANSLVWGDLTGEPSLLTNVAVTSLTHAEIGASGTFPVTLNFTRTKTDGTTDTATKVVNVVATITLPKPVVNVWYYDHTGNVYKDGIKLYTLKITNDIKNQLLIDKKNNSYWMFDDGLYFNGTKKWSNNGRQIRSFALDKDGNIFVATSNSGHEIIKISKETFVEEIYYTDNSKYYTAISVDKDGIPYYYDLPTKSLYKAKGELISDVDIQGRDIQYIFFDYENNLYYISDTNRVFKNKVTNGKFAYWISFDKENNIYYAGEDKKIYKNDTIIKTNDENLSSISVDPNSGDIYYSTFNKKVYKISNLNGNYSDPVVIYTTEDTDCKVRLNVEIGSITGNWGE